MYTPDYKMVGDNQYVGIIKENNKTIMMGNAKKKSATEALRHAEAYIHEHYMHELNDKILKCKYSCIIFVMLTVFMFLRSLLIPTVTNVVIVLSAVAGVALAVISACFGVLWWTSYYEYRTLVESYDFIPQNFFDR